MDEPCAVHFVGISRLRDLALPTPAQVYNYTGLNGLAPDFNGTINVTQAGIPFSSGTVASLQLQPAPRSPALLPAVVCCQAQASSTDHPVMSSLSGGSMDVSNASKFRRQSVST